MAGDRRMSSSEKGCNSLPVIGQFKLSFGWLVVSVNARQRFLHLVQWRTHHYEPLTE